MAKHRELARIVSNKMWRTIVVSGAMLATPMIAAGCGGGTKKPPTTVEPMKGSDPAAGDPAADKAAADKAAADQAAADKAAAQAAEEKAAADKAEQDKAAAELAAAEEKRKADEAAAAKKKPVKRPRGGGDRPTGRGFILS